MVVVVVVLVVVVVVVLVVVVVVVMVVVIVVVVAVVVVVVVVVLVVVVDWLIDNGVRDFTAPVHLGLIKQALCAIYPIQGSPAALLKLQITPKLVFLMSSGSRK